MHLRDIGGAIVVRTGAGQPPEMVRLRAGTYTLVIQRAAIDSADNQVAFVMAFRRVVQPAGQAQAALASSADQAGSDSDASVINYDLDPQILDATAQTNFKVPGDAPAIAIGNLHQATA